MTEDLFSQRPSSDVSRYDKAWQEYADKLEAHIRKSLAPPSLEAEIRQAVREAMVPVHRADTFHAKELGDRLLAIIEKHK